MTTPLHSVTVPAGTGASLRITPAAIARLEAVIDASGLGDWFEHELTGGRPRGAGTRVGGMVRQVSARAMLVGLLALAWSERPLILRDLVGLLNGLAPAVKRRLGLPRAQDGGVTERQVSYLFGRMSALLDPSPYSAANRDKYEQARDATVAEHLDIAAAARTGETDDRLTDEQQAALTAALAAVKAEHALWLTEQHARLRWVLDRGLDATLPADITHTGSYAVDGSEVRTWARQNRRQPKHPWLHPDPDAAWNGKKTWGRQGRTNGWFGYQLHGVVRVGEVGAPDVPCLAERIELTPANADARDAGRVLLTRMVADHEAADDAAGLPHRPRRDVLADRAYTSETHRADDWVWPLWELGFTSVHQLTEHQLGEGNRRSRRPGNGAVVIDGQPYSPRLPQHLRNIAPPPIAASRADIDTYQQLIAQRRLYALHPVGGRNDDGSWDFGCRAMALLGQLRCDLKPDSLALPYSKPTTSPAVFTPANGRLPKVCGQQKSRIHREELPFWQPDLYGSADWYASYNRRNRVEGVFGNVKNDAAQDLTRGNIRVMGLAKTSLLTLVTVMAANLRLLDRWRERQARAARGEDQLAKVPRKPRRRTRLLQATRARVAAAKADAAAVAAHDPAAGRREPALT